MAIETEPRAPLPRHRPGPEGRASAPRAAGRIGAILALAILVSQAGCMSALTATTLREALRETAASMSASHDLEHASRPAPRRDDADADADADSGEGDAPAEALADDEGAIDTSDEAMEKVIDNAVARLSAAGGIDPATQELLIQTLEKTPPQDWAVVVNEFAATLEATRGDAARAAAEAAARIAGELTGRGESPGQESAGEEGAGQDGAGQQAGQGSQGKQQSGGRGSPPSPERLQSLLESREVQDALRMAERSERVQARAGRRAAEQLAAAQAASQQEGQGEGQPGATPTGEPTVASTDGGAQAGQAAIKEADLRGLDARRRAAIERLPPRVRDPLLEGMRERGPEAYRDVIETYFRRLGKDVAP